MTEFFDITRTLRNGMAVWPGDPEFRQRRVIQIKEGGSTNVTEICLGTHTGTHVDAPLHMDDSGGDAAAIPLGSLVGPARVVQMDAKTSIRAADLSPLDWAGVERLLFKTRCSSLPESHFDRDFVSLEADAAEFLANRGILLVGTDAPSVDSFDSADLPSHRILTGHGIVILEGIRLDAVPPGDYFLACLPLKLTGADGSPVRAVLWRSPLSFSL